MKNGNEITALRTETVAAIAALGKANGEEILALRKDFSRLERRVGIEIAVAVALLIIAQVIARALSWI